MDEAMIPTLDAAEQLGVDVVEVYRIIDEGRLLLRGTGSALLSRWLKLRR